MLLVVLFLVVPLVELFVIVQVAQSVGVGETFLLLIAVSILGAWLVKRQGVTVWRRFNDTLAGGQIPHREIIDGALILFAGALMLTPGFVTDVCGVLLLLPPTRAIVRRGLIARLGTGAVLTSFAASRFPGRGSRARSQADADVWDADSWENNPSPPGEAPGDPRDPGELGS